MLRGAGGAELALTVFDFWLRDRMPSNFSAVFIF